MAFVASFNSRLYVGSAHWSVYAKGVNLAESTAMLDVTTINDADETFIPGQNSGTIALDMLLDNSGAAGSQFITLNTWKGTPQVVTFASFGTTRGTPCKLIYADQSNFTVNSSTTEAVGVSGAYMTDGLVGYGVVLDPSTAITTNTTATSVDNGAASTAGGVAHLHVTAFSGLTSDTITLEHSTDNSSFSTLATFAVVSAATVERLTINGTINRYVRVKDTVVGTGSCTRIVALSRN